MRTAGQVCSAGTRVLAEYTVYQDLTDRLGQAADALSLGPAAHDPDVGPVISAIQRDHVTAAITKSIVEGASPVTRRRLDDHLGGFFVAPTILRATDPSSFAAREEIFGPVVTVLPFEGERQAVCLVNDSDYGLVTGIWTGQISRAHRVAAQVHAGQVFINSYGVGGGVELPFGGYKRSGFGRLKGVAGAYAYTQLKNVSVALS